MQEIERSAASVEEAIELALRELGVSEQEAQVSILQEPRGGFLGINSQAAVVRVRVVEPTSEDEPEVDRQAEVGADFIEGLLSAMGLDADVEISQVDGVGYVDVWGVEGSDDMGLLIGKGGHTVEALQEVVRSHIHQRTGERCRIQVDVEDYRKRRRSQLVRRARDAAREVKRTGKQKALEPMNAFERKVVHDAVSEVGGVDTSSEGEEPDRYVVIRKTT